MSPYTAIVRVVGSGWANGTGCSLSRMNGTNDLTLFNVRTSAFGCTVYQYQKAVFTAPYSEIDVFIGEETVLGSFAPDCPYPADGCIIRFLSPIASSTGWYFTPDGMGGWTLCDTGSGVCTDGTVGTIDSVTIIE